MKGILQAWTQNTAKGREIFAIVAVETKASTVIPSDQLRFFLAIRSRKMFRLVYSAMDSLILAGFGNCWSVRPERISATCRSPKIWINFP
jgi:hypothetical protein